MEYRTAQKIKFFAKGFFSKWNQIQKKMGICSHLLKQSLTECNVTNWYIHVFSSYTAICKADTIPYSFVFTSCLQISLLILSEFEAN